MIKHKIPSTKKGRKWIEEAIKDFLDGSETSYSVRKTLEEMKENYDILQGIIPERLIQNANNPFKTNGKNAPLSDIVSKDVVVINPTIETLLGEEISRGFDYQISVINREAINKKLFNKRQYLVDRLSEIFNPQKTPTDKIENELNKLEEYMMYEYRDGVEKAGKQLLEYYFDKYSYSKMFNDCFRDVLAIGEEIVRFEKRDNEIVPEKVNSTNLKVFGTQQYIEDADIIIEEESMTKSEIITKFGNMLSDKQIAELYNDTYDDNYSGAVKYFDGQSPLNKRIPLFERLTLDDVIDGNYENTIISESTHIVSRVFFKSLRDVNILQYNHQITGEPMKRIVDSKYEPNKEFGESIIEKIWVTDWYNGYRIDEDIYFGCERCELQRRDIDNFYISYPPYIGLIYNYNGEKPYTMVDKLKPIQAKWSLFNLRLDDLQLRNLGKLVEINVSMIPNFKGMSEKDLELFLAWITNNGIILKNPYNNMGQGKDSGMYDRPVQVIDADTSTMLNNVIGYLQYLRELADTIAGVNQQRRGQGAASEGLGVTQERITRSSIQTEYIYTNHIEFKKRVSLATLYYGTLSLRNGNKKLNMVTDDMTQQIIEVNGDELALTDFGLHIIGDKATYNMLQNLPRLIEVAMSNGTPIADIADVMLTNSIIQKVNVLKKADKRRQLQQQEAMKAQEAEKQKMLEMQLMQQKQLQEFEMAKLQYEMNMKLEIEAMKLANVVDNTDELEIKRAIEESKLKSKEMIERFKINAQKDIANNHDSTLLKIAKEKPKPNNK